jgi:TolB protein
VIEPLPFALPTFIAADGGATDVAQDITRVIAADLRGTGLFRQIPPDAYISQVTSFDSPVQYPDWQAINAQALITGEVETRGEQIVVRFRLFDVFSQAPLGEGLQFVGEAASWRRMAHTVADEVYERITGRERVFRHPRRLHPRGRAEERAPQAPRDHGLRRCERAVPYRQPLAGAGAAVQPAGRSHPLHQLRKRQPAGLPDGRGHRHAPSAGGDPGRQHDLRAALLARWQPRGLLAGTGRQQRHLHAGPRHRPRTQLTNAPSIETAPSFSPDGSQIVFESDRTGGQQIYVMPASGGEAVRISRGTGRYGTPVWSPRGDYIAFTKQEAGRFHIGVMRTDGSEERLLTASFLDEGPTWAPNGRVIMFTRETAGADGAPAVYSVDLTGRNLQRVATPGMASDPAWSPLQ